MYKMLFFSNHKILKNVKMLWVEYRARTGDLRNHNPTL